MITATTQNGFKFSIPSSFNGYKCVSEIGRGGNSVVYKVVDVQTDVFYAAKFVSRQHLMEKDLILQFEQELRVHQYLKHPNIVEMHQVIYMTHVIIVILEYCELGDMFGWVQKGNFYNKGAVRVYFSQLCRALSYLHSKGIAHMDIKPENVFLDEHHNIKLGDFGCCETSIQKISGSLHGTIDYTAPEVILGECLDKRKADIWSLGIFLYVLSSGSSPWEYEEEGDERVNIQNQILKGKIPYHENSDFVVYQLIILCLNQRPCNRPTIDLLLQHPYIKERNIQPHKIYKEKNPIIITPHYLSSPSIRSQKLKLSYKARDKRGPSKSLIIRK